MKYFLDSSFIISYSLEDDVNHERALELAEDIFKDDCYILGYVINEVVTVMGNKSNLNYAKKTYYILVDNFKILPEHENKNFNNDVMYIYSQFNTKLSFTDCSIIKVMEKNNISNLVSFDKYFDKTDIKRIF